MNESSTEPVFEAAGEKVSGSPTSTIQKCKLGNPRKSAYIYRYSRNWNFANLETYTITGKERDLARFGEAT